MLIASLLLAVLSTGCTHTGSARSGVLPRTLPATPAWVAPVKVLRPPDGTDWEIVAKREQNGRIENAARLNCVRRWIDERRTELAGGTAKPLAGCPTE